LERDLYLILPEELMVEDHNEDSNLDLLIEDATSEYIWEDSVAG
jgi:hypothetical protein